MALWKHPVHRGKRIFLVKNKPLKWMAPLLLTGSALLLTACVMNGKNARTSKPVVSAPHVDLAKYMGDWHVIANIPYWAEKDCYGSIENYRLQPDQRIATVFSYRKGGWDQPLKKAKSVARVTNDQTNAEWSVMFLGGLVKVPLVIVAVPADYRYAAVATPDRKLAWIFSRQQTLSPLDYTAAEAALKMQGIDTTQLVKVPQVP